MQLATRIVYHLLPLIPLAFGLKWIAAAVLLLVLLSYIKVKKLDQQIIDFTRRGVDPREIAGIRKTRNFWLGLTFLKDRSDRAEG